MADRARRRAARAEKWRKDRDEVEMGVALTTFVLCVLVAAIALPLLWYLGRWISRRRPAGHGG
jgi:hypothetical protein